MIHQSIRQVNGGGFCLDMSKLRSQFCESVTPVAGSIFEPLSQTHFSKSELKNEISSSALLDIQLILLCVCGVDSFLPELEHL